ncbi:NAD(+) diphosphatase [Deinococcus radiophilus]|uniref:NAD(+) diphosphatase n=1 Tax=Deinococcus radiophilus TaxID=32062 RepID=UPI001E44D609|nr:NAD(+) diphosphatase [Deinococcus radiophilus]UFA51659.1 NAD(+) diphosphatase [Deinococcus radiophilus]
MPHITAALGLGKWQGKSYAAAYSSQAIGPEQTTTLRELASRSPEDAALAGYAAQILDFHQSHRFCGRCASPTQALNHEQARRCPQCGLTSYPRVAPAVMVLIWRGKGTQREFLLARGPRHRPGLYSVIAGFVEPSETLEDCCHREALEELGVTIRDPQYVLSQPWPLPHSLMVAFTAEYVGGDIVPQPGEIEAAQWFPAHDLPEIPPAYSCAYQLIQRGVQQAQP